MSNFRRIAGLAFFLMAASITFVSCKGGECSATKAPDTDADSDCVLDSSDNCPYYYNPEQVDVDDDGIGSACDSNDADSTVALILPPAELVASLGYNLADLTYPISPLTPTINPLATECVGAVVVGCGDAVLLSADTAVSDASWLAGSGAFGGDGPCSSNSVSANEPPALFCQASTGNLEFAGYLTRNSQTPFALDACQVPGVQEWFAENVCP